MIPTITDISVDFSFCPHKKKKSTQYFFHFPKNYAKIQKEIVRWQHIGSPRFDISEEGRVPQGMRFFSLYTTYYLRTEIINTINVAKAIINDNASYTLMLITSLPRGKPNTSNYLIDYSLANVSLNYKE